MKSTVWASVLVAVLGSGVSVSLGSIVVPWDAGQGKYYLDMPMTTEYSPETSSGFWANGGSSWFTNKQTSGSGTWHFVLPSGVAAQDVTVEITVYNRGGYNWGGYHTTDFGTTGAIDQSVGACWWNSVSSDGGELTYSNTFTAVNSNDLYVAHNIVNGWTWATAQQLLSMKITATPEPATLGLLAMGVMGLIRRK